MLTLYKSLVLSHLDYCSALWHPSSAADTARIEKVQQNFTKKIIGLHELNYHERLKKLSLFSLQRRRERYIIIYMFKILNNQVPNPGVSFKFNERTGYHAEIKLLNSSLATNVKKMRWNSFQYVGPRLYNTLPEDLRRCYSNYENPSDVFKAQLDGLLHNLPDQPTIPGIPRAANSNSVLDQIKHSKN